jgi:hypothetical protein
MARILAFWPSLTIIIEIGQRQVDEQAAVIRAWLTDTGMTERPLICPDTHALHDS